MKQREADHFTAVLKRRTRPEFRRIYNAFKRLEFAGYKGDSEAVEVAVEIVLAGDETLRRRDSDRRTDRGRRILVGARVPRAKAELYKAAAERDGVSLYRWVINAFDAYLESNKSST